MTNTLTFRKGLDQPRNVGDFVKEVELALEEDGRSARQVLLDLLRQRFQSLTELD